MLSKAICRLFAQKLGRESVHAANQKMRILNTAPNAKVSRRIAAVQNDIEMCDSYERFLFKMAGFASQARNAGCSMIAYPEYICFDLLGLIPAAAWIDKAAPRRSCQFMLPDRPVRDAAADGFTKAVFRAMAGCMPLAVNAAMACIAKAFDIVVYSGTYPVLDEGNLYNEGTVFDCSGKVIGRQRKIHLVDEEKALGFCSADTLNIFNTEAGRCCFPVCMDATYFETFFAARRQRVDFVVVPIANQEEYSEGLARRGVYARVLESGMNTLKTANTGWLFGKHFTGHAEAFKPDGCGRPGAPQQTASPEGRAVIIADFDEWAKKTETEYYGDRNDSFEQTVFG